MAPCMLVDRVMYRDGALILKQAVKRIVLQWRKR